MRGFIKNCKGAVTVFVTLLIIPTLLISGTGVDLARIHSGRSAVRNANQLALNSVLASYDAVLQDLYGLFAVMKTDAELSAMVDVYIRATLFGIEQTVAEVGEFRLLWGSEVDSLQAPNVRSFDELSDMEILRRQIEEYAKWRAPVAVVVDILDRLKGDFERIGADSEAISSKFEIDAQMEAILEQYAALFREIEAIYRDFRAVESAAFDAMNGVMVNLHEQLSNLLDVRKQFQAESDETGQRNIKHHYNAILGNITSIINGGRVGTGWVTPSPIHPEGRWTTTDNVQSFSQLRQHHVSSLEGFSSRLDNLVTMSRNIDAARGRLQNAISNLEARLQRGDITPELARGLQEDIDELKPLLTQDFGDLSARMRDANNEHINNVVRTLNNINAFGTINGNEVVNPRTTFEQLARANEINLFPIEFGSENDDPIEFNRENDTLRNLVNTTGRFAATGGFRYFPNISGEHRTAHEVLRRVLSVDLSTAQQDAERGDGAADSIMEDNGIIGAFTQIVQIWDDAFGFDVKQHGGATQVILTNNQSSFRQEPGGRTLNLAFGARPGRTWRETAREVRDLLRGDISIVEIIQNALNDLANRALLVTYANHMFSNWTTDPNVENRTMSGHLLSPDINYFFMSELEYLFYGSDSARSNLRAVGYTILVIRLLMNIVSSYAIREVSREIRALKATVALIPFVGKALSLLVRPLYVFSESVIDLARLRDGEAVVITKINEDRWRFQVRNFANLRGDGSGDSFGIYYRDYLTIFLLAGDPNRIASRMGDLIMLNVTNFKYTRTLRGGAMENAIAARPLFDLGEASTGFRLTTSVDLRLIFLSMPQAQDGEWVNFRPLTEFSIVQTDYRGY